MVKKGYSCDSSELEWAFAAPYLPLIAKDVPKLEHDLRSVYDTLKYVIRTGIP